jgi:hypothetical protein
LGFSILVWCLSDGIAICGTPLKPLQPTGRGEGIGLQDSGGAQNTARNHEKAYNRFMHVSVRHRTKISVSGIRELAEAEKAKQNHVADAGPPTREDVADDQCQIEN